MGKVILANIFGNGMVLQRQKNIRIFGRIEDNSENEYIYIEFCGKKYRSMVINQKWEVYLPAMEADTNISMKIIYQNEEIIIKDIAIGEVWLAGGQSNMEFMLKDAYNGENMLQNDKNINVRYYNVPRQSFIDEEFYKNEKECKWEKFGDNGCKEWSAVAYVYAKKLSKKLGVTVGIIGCNYGGTSASAWIDKETIVQDSELKIYIDEYEKEVEGKSVEQQIKEYDEYVEYAKIWQEKCDECYKNNPDIEWNDVLKIAGECKYPGVMGAKNPMRPAGLYECMFKRVIPYTIKGFIYYQGESDDHRPYMYYKLLLKLIQKWRSDFEDDKLHFLMVQLPMHRYSADKDTKAWCYIREAQMKIFNTVKNTGIAVILDCGEFNEIHPKNKIPVGERLALQALNLVYNIIEEDLAFAPTYKECIYNTNEIELHFEHIKGGFVVKGNVCGFEVAGYDKKYVKANVRIDGEYIYLSADNIDNIRYARYCWSNYADVTVFGKNGLPLAPFRTTYGGNGYGIY